MQDDDSGTAAVMVAPELKELRSTCDRLGIKWHHRNKEATLQERIDTETGEVPVASTVPDPPETKPKQARKPRQPRGIPQEISEALEYMNSYHRARARRVREYIESLL